MAKFETRAFSGADGIRLVGDVGGDVSAPTVLFLHGGGQTRHSWGAAVRRLADAGYRTINMDARGHGDSSWSPDGSYAVGARSADLALLLEQVNQPVAVVGASMGGATALYAASRAAPGAIAALILVDIVPSPSVEGVKRIQDFMRRHLEGFDSIDAAIAAVAAYNPHRSGAPNPGGMRKNLRAAPGGKLKWHWDPGILNLDAQSEFLCLNAVMSAMAHAWPPTLLIRGLNSDVVVEAGISELRKQIPQLEVLDVPRAGHMVAGDSNDAFNAGIIDYLKRYLPA